MLPRNQKRALEKLAGRPWISPFRLVGGTALALQYGHRASEDIDLFSHRAFETGEVILELERLGSFTLKRKSDYAVTGTWEGAEVTFLYYQYPWIRDPEFVRPFSMPLAHPLDIGLMKIEAISQRGARRDFVDLFFACRRERPLAEFLDLYPKKFRRRATPIYHILRSLSYFEDAERQPEVATRPRVSWKEIRAYFETEVAKIARERLKS